ncbi:hypothetical protein CB1_000614013 [Camelus ferus]|nr:hypothetical protein CB1_000614013 [Camelus ferus]
MQLSRSGQQTGPRGAPAGVQAPQKPKTAAQNSAFRMQTLLVRLVALLGLMSRLLETSALTGAPWGRASRVFLSPSQVKDRRLGLKVKDSNFTLGGFPSLILAGTIHYFRVPKEYWRDRLLKLKACGFNTVTTVFISMALEVDLWVILCPGPYIGSDLDLGGLPSWLLRDPKMKLRTTYKGFTKAVNHYFDELIPRIVSLQVQEDGPIIAVQLENEYGSYHMDKKYMPYVKKALVTRGVKTLLMTADTGQDLTGGHVKNAAAPECWPPAPSSSVLAWAGPGQSKPYVLATLHLRSINKATYETLSSFQGPSPVLMTVYTASAPDGWGALRHSLDPHLVMRDAREMLAFRFSLNFYMFHGGTNFGFMGGSAPLHNYLSTVTSYGKSWPPAAACLFIFSSCSAPSVVLLDCLWAHRGTEWLAVSVSVMRQWSQAPPTLSAKPVSMEKLSVNQGSGQSSGYILYETAISSGGLLTSRGHVQDRGQVFLDNLYIGVLDHASTELTLPRRSDYEGSQMLRILVENQGRLAYGPDINKERKVPSLGLRLASGQTLGSRPPHFFRQIVVFEEWKSALVIQFTDSPQLGSPVPRGTIPQNVVAFCPRAECQAVLPATEHGLRHLHADPQTSTERTPESAALGSGQQRGDGSSVGRGLLGLAVMGPPPRFRASTVPFFPAVRFNWSHLTPLELKDRSVGLQAEEGVGRNPYFTLEGHEFLIFGGSIHYFRVPREYWRDRLLKLRACGFNTVTTYVPWNLHEPERGKFDFSGNLDLDRLLQDPTTQLRTTNRTFVEAVDKYFDHLIARVVPLQYRKGGPIIAVQVENEYGSFNKDKNYMPYLHKALLERGVVELLLTSDNTNKVLNGHIKGVLATINMNSFRADTFEQLFKVQKNKPILIMEYWVGWFDTWGKRHTPTDAGDVENTVTEFIQLDISFNVYMFHGGTNFGFMNGGIHFTHYRAVITSYGKCLLQGPSVYYDAVLTEAGDYTDKYFKLRKLFQSVFVTPLPLLPKPTHKAVYPSMRLSLYLPLWDVLQYLNRGQTPVREDRCAVGLIQCPTTCAPSDKSRARHPVVSRTPLNMENLPIHGGNGQAFGLVLYEATICSGGRLHVEARDAAQVFLNETSLGILADETQNVDVPTITECQLLRILVENQGRVNFSWKIQDQRKGIIGSVTINSVPLENFTIYSLEMRTSFFRRLRTAIWRPVSDDHLGPAFYLGTLKAGSSPRDTFLALPSWKYGFVFINGRNLGRYWNIGPQGTLYLPGAWLNPGNNEIILFEKRKSGSYIYSTDKPVL